MSVKASLLIDGIETNILTYNFTFNQAMDANNRPAGIPRFEGITIKIESQKAIHLADWAIAHNQTKQLQLIISPVTQTGKTRTLHLFDCHLVGWYNRFSSTGVNPKTETLNITCGGIREDSDTLEYSAPWRTTFDVPPPESNEEEEEEKEPKILECYYTDLEGNKQAEPKTGEEIILVLVSENAAGETVDINLSNHTKDFIYNNEVLEDDTIKGFSITSDTHEIKLRVVAQQDGERATIANN